MKKILCLSTICITTLFPFTIKNVKAEEDLSIDGLQVHLDAQIDKTSNGNNVDTIKNIANYNLKNIGDAKQDLVSKQPVFVKNSSINNKPAYRFSSDKFMQIGNNKGFDLNDMTIFVVENFTSLNNYGEIISRVSDGAPWEHNFFFNIENKLWNYGWSTSNNGIVSYPQSKISIEKETSYVLSSRKSGNEGNMFINGILSSSFNGGNPNENYNIPVTLGSRTKNPSFVGDLGELLIFNRGLTNLEMTKVEKYLENKWSLEDSHNGQLADISINGETIYQFNSNKTNYRILYQEDVDINDITYTTWSNSDKVDITKENNVIKLKVTTKNGKEVTYMIEIETKKYDYNEIKQLNTNEVQLNQGYWTNLYEQYSTYTVNYMFDMFDKSKSFDNFDRVANGEKKVLNNTSEHAGQILKPINDRDVYNTQWEWIYEPWREGLIYEGIRAAGEFVKVNRTNKDYITATDALVKRVNGYIDRIYSASLKTTAKDGNGKPIDGYFSTFNILDRNWVCDETDVSARYHHDLYNYGCLVEAALYWYEATGDTRLLFAATRFTEFIIDYMDGRDGYQGYKVVPPHQLPEETLQNLYDLYENNPDLVKLMEEKYSKVEGLSSKDRYYNLKIRLPRYKEIASFWISGRGHSEGRYNNTNYGVYAQDNVDYDHVSEALGHAVRANLWYNGIAHIANKQSNFSYARAALNIWNNIVSSQMYVTGGTGSTNDGEEAYGGSNKLPQNGYCETCASVGMAFYGQNMFNLLGKGEFVDTVELEMYNNILGCLGLDGNSFYYTNPMTSYNYTRPMFSNATPCCVPMFLKFYSELPELIYAKTNDKLFINQFVSSSMQTHIGNNKVTLIQGTDLPNGNKLLLNINSSSTLLTKIRMPSWANGASLKVNGAQKELVLNEDGYIDVEINQGTSNIEIIFNKEVIRLHQDYAQDNVGQTSIKYGPFVYCAEEVDNGEIIKNKDFEISKNEEIFVEEDNTMFNLKVNGVKEVPLPVNILTTTGYYNGVNYDLTLIPFFARGNRKTGQMRVWFKE